MVASFPKFCYNPTPEEDELEVLAEEQVYDIFDEETGQFPKQEDVEKYYEIWEKFDPEETQFIRYDQLSDLLDALEPPLQICKPNKFKIVSMDIEICEDDLIYQADLLVALSTNLLLQYGFPFEEPENVGSNRRPDLIGYNPVSSTLWRQREECCARIIQHTWWKYKQHKADGHDGTGNENATGDEHKGGK